MTFPYHPVKYIIKQLTIVLIEYEWVIVETPVISHIYIYMCVYVYTYICTYVYVCVCARVRACVRSCVLACMCSYAFKQCANMMVIGTEPAYCFNY